MRSVVFLLLFSSVLWPRFTTASISLHLPLIFKKPLAGPASHFGHDTETCRRHFKTGALYDGSGAIFSLEVSAIPCKAAQSPARLLLLLRVFKLSFEVTSDIFKATKPLHEKRSCEPSLPDRLAALTGKKEKKKKIVMSRIRRATLPELLQMQQAYKKTQQRPLSCDEETKLKGMRK